MDCQEFREFIELEVSLEEVTDYFIAAYRHSRTCVHCEEYLAASCREHEMTVTPEQRKRAKRRFRRFFRNHAEKLIAVNVDIERAV